MLVTEGTPETVVISPLISEVYGVHAQLGVNPLTGRAAVHLGGSINGPLVGGPAA